MPAHRACLLDSPLRGRGVLVKGARRGRRRRSDGPGPNGGGRRYRWSPHTVREQDLDVGQDPTSLVRWVKSRRGCSRHLQGQADPAPPAAAPPHSLHAAPPSTVSSDRPTRRAAAGARAWCRSWPVLLDCGSVLRHERPRTCGSDRVLIVPKGGASRCRLPSWTRCVERGTKRAGLAHLTRHQLHRTCFTRLREDGMALGRHPSGVRSRLDRVPGRVLGPGTTGALRQGRAGGAGGCVLWAVGGISPL